MVNSIVSLLLSMGVTLQAAPMTQANPSAKTEAVSLELDHVLALVSDDRLMDAVEKAGFSVLDHQSRHAGQGTSGRYVFFYNGYLEFLALDKVAEARANEARFGSDYVARWGDMTRACPLGAGLRAKPFTPESFPFRTHRYLPAIPGEKPGERFYEMDLGNRDLARPFVFVSQPGAAHPTIHALSDLDVVSDLEKRKALKAAHTHRLGVKRLTHVAFEVPTSTPEASLAAFRGTKGMSVTRGKRCHVTLTFDEGGRGKTLTPLKGYPLTLRY